MVTEGLVITFCRVVLVYAYILVMNSRLGNSRRRTGLQYQIFEKSAWGLLAALCPSEAPDNRLDILISPSSTQLIL